MFKLFCDHFIFPWTDPNIKKKTKFCLKYGMLRLKLFIYLISIFIYSTFFLFFRLHSAIQLNSAKWSYAWVVFMPKEPLFSFTPNFWGLGTHKPTWSHWGGMSFLKTSVHFCPKDVGLFWKGTLVIIYPCPFMPTGGWISFVGDNMLFPCVWTSF